MDLTDEQHFNHLAGRPGTGRRTRPSMEGSMHGIEWCLMDSTSRRAMERSALTIRPISDCSSALQKLGAFRRNGKTKFAVRLRPAVYITIATPKCA